MGRGRIFCPRGRHGAMSTRAACSGRGLGGALLFGFGRGRALRPAISLGGRFSDLLPLRGRPWPAAPASRFFGLAGCGTGVLLPLPLPANKTRGDEAFLSKADQIFLARRGAGLRAPARGSRGGNTASARAAWPFRAGRAARRPATCRAGRGRYRTWPWRACRGWGKNPAPARGGGRYRVDVLQPAAPRRQSSQPGWLEMK